MTRILYNLSYSVCYREAQEEAKKRRGQTGPVKQQFEIPPQFICPICNKIMTDAVKTSCCATHYCDQCESV